MFFGRTGQNSVHRRDREHDVKEMLRKTSRPPKHTGLVVYEWPLYNCLKVIQMAPQSLDNLTSYVSHDLLLNVYNIFVLESVYAFKYD